MSRLNLKQASLLDASGELGDAARQKLLARMMDDPQARKQHQAAEEAMTLLRSLPIPEPSAAERRAIPLRLKQAIYRALQEKEAKKTAEIQPTVWTLGMQLLRRSARGLALAACLAMVVGLVFAGWTGHRQRVAGINAMIDRVARLSNSPATSYEQKVTDVEASIRQLQTESPTLACVTDTGIANLFLALAAEADVGGEGEFDDSTAMPESF